MSKTLHGLLFLEEFTFASNRFTPPSGTEIELADAVVLLGDVLLVCQIKQRDEAQAGTDAVERNWFQSKVIKIGTKQVRDTLTYLSSHSEIKVKNQLDREFDLGGRAYSSIIKIIIYHGSATLPADCRAIRYYVSRSAGFIHIVDARDYLEIARTLRVPEDFVRYFDQREKIFTQFWEQCEGVPEAAVAGHFIRPDPEGYPTLDSIAALHSLIQDEEEWNLAPLLRGLRESLSITGVDNDYYPIVTELARQPRFIWREIKRRIVLCVKKARADEFERPYRIVTPNGCGFVFVPVTSAEIKRPDWAQIRQNGLLNFVRGHMYDQRIEKCIGVIVGYDDSYYDIWWCMLEQPWVYDEDIDRALTEKNPFRPVRPAEVHGYRFRE